MFISHSQFINYILTTYTKPLYALYLILYLSLATPTFADPNRQHHQDPPPPTPADSSQAGPSQIGESQTDESQADESQKTPSSPSTQPQQQPPTHQNRTQTQSSVAEPTIKEPKSPVLFDTPYQVAVKDLGATWQLLNTDAAKKLSPLARLGAVEAGRTLGLILVESAAGLNLEQYAQAVINHSPLNELLIERAEEVDFQGLDAIRLLYTGETPQGRFRYLNYLLLREGYGYQISAGGRIGDVTDASLNHFSTHVTLLKGPLTPQDQHTLANRRGGLWRLQNGRFESIKDSIRISPIKGWRMITGMDARALYNGSDIVLSLEDPAVHIAFATHPCPSSDATECTHHYLKEFERTAPVQSLGDGRIEQLDAQALQLNRYAGSDGTFNYLHGIRVYQKQALEVVAWTLNHQEDTAWTVLSQALSAVQFLSQKERVKLQIELQTSDAPNERWFTDQDRYMDGVYQHFKSGVIWRRPGGLWELSKLPTTEGVGLQLYAPRHAHLAQIWIQKGDNSTLSDQHALRWANLMRDIPLQDEPQVFKSQGSYVSTARTSGDHPRRYRLMSRVAKGSMIHIIHSAPDALFTTAVQRQIEENLTFTNTVGALSFNRGRYTDHRFGFSITHLPEGGSLMLHPMLAAGDSSTMMSYHTPDGALFSGFAVSSSRPLEDQRLLSNISAALGLTASPTKLAPPKEVWLHGVPARKWTWVSPEGQVQIYLLNIPPLIYGFLTLSSQASHSASNTKKPRFELVKP